MTPSSFQRLFYAVAIMLQLSAGRPASGQGMPIRGGNARPLEYVADERGNRIPDFSHCGYAGSDHAIPDLPPRVVVTPHDGDDGLRIQAAINHLAKLPVGEDGFRGAVQLLAGEYQVAGDLRLLASGVVLRGAGGGVNGTTLIATGQGRRPLIRIGNQQSIPVEVFAGEPAAIADDYVPVGAMSLRVDKADQFQPGDRVLITRPSTDEWIETLGARAPGVGWRAGRCDIHWDRIVTKVDGDEFTLDAPLTTALDRQFGGGTMARFAPTGRVENVGIENLSLRSAYDESNPHDEEHSWFGVVANHAENFWIRRVRFEHFVGGAVLLREATKWATVEDCLALAPVSEIGGYRRQSYFTQGGLTLLLRCYAEQGRHDFAVGHCAPGPNALVNCYAARAHKDSGPLESWASGVLYDNVRIDGSSLQLENRWTKPPGAGWSAANCVLWQCQAAVIRAFRPPAANNWVLGYWAEPMGDATIVGQSEFVRPLSLFQAQVAERLGDERAQSIGPFLLDPAESTSPSRREAAKFVASSNKPGLMLRDLIEKRLAATTKSDPIDAPNVEDVASIEKPGGKSAESLHQIEITNGWITLNGRVLTGGHVNPTWWRGTLRPRDAAEFGPSITRFAPGRYGVGLTDQLEDVARSMIDESQTVYDHHYGLWYDRRRDDHLMVRRADGDVAPPFFEQPFARTGRGTAWDGLSKYDLPKFNPWYWQRLTDFAALCDRNGLVLFHQHYFQHNILEAGAHWADSPWRPANNVNDTGLPEPPPYVGDKRIFLAHQFYDTDNAQLHQLHEGYIRHCLDQHADHTNVVHSISAEYTGPLKFTQFWLDTIRAWQADTGHDALVALAATKDVQDAILIDRERGDVVDIIDIRYWCYTRDGELYAPPGGANMAPRQHQRQMGAGAADFASVARAVREYRLRFPEKPVTYYADMYCRSPRDGWAVLMGGGSLADVPPLPVKLAEAIPAMQPVEPRDSMLALAAPGRDYLFFALEPTEEIELSLPAGEQYHLTEIDADTGKANATEQLVSDGQRVNVDERVIWLRRVDERD